MAKQKIVMKVTMKDPKTRSKAMKLVAGFPGVLSTALEADKDQITVVGEEVDSVCLTRLLRKKIGHTELASVGSAEKKDEKKDDKKEEVKVIYTPMPHVVEVESQPGCESCTIM